MSESTYYAGIDIGSVSTKAVLISDGKILASGITVSGGSYREAVHTVFDAALCRVGIGEGDLSGVVITGVGAESAPIEGRRVSDISCQAMGCHHVFASARTVIDIGGQFTKAARITPEGRVADFLISEKCATGSGRFLQVIARILQVNLDDIAPFPWNPGSRWNFPRTVQCSPNRRRSRESPRARARRTFWRVCIGPWPPR